MPAKESKEVVRRYFEEFHSGRQHDILDEIVTSHLVGPTREATRRLRAAFLDYRITIKEQVAEGDAVATVWSMRGTHQGEWESPTGTIPPTGRQVEFTATTTLRVTDGKIADVIGTNWDHLGILQQMDAIPTVTPRSGA